MKRWFGFAFAAVLAWQVADTTAAGAQPLRIGIDGTYPPFSQAAKGGKFTGFDVEIAEAICKQMEVQCRLVQLDNWATVMPDLNAGKYDAVVASMSITPERMRQVDFTTKYYHSPAVFIAKKGLDLSGTSSLAGKRVAVQRATTHDGFLSAKHSGAFQVSRQPTLEAALEELVAGRVDLVMGDSLALQKGFLASDKGKAFEIVGPRFTDPYWFGLGAGIALPKNNGELRDRMNRALAAIRADGTYRTISERYFAYDIAGD
jgi:arginine/ornithine transport system substrate-binding protein